MVEEDGKGEKRFPERQDTVNGQAVSACSDPVDHIGFKDGRGANCCVDLSNGMGKRQGTERFAAYLRSETIVFVLLC